ncbi:MAG: GNAT family N-acetyltransferase [Pseudomonadota bacterium]
MAEVMFEAYPKEIILSDGTGLTLRPLRAGDEEGLHRMFSRFSPDDRWFLEGDVTDFDLIKRWVNRRDSEKKVALVGELEGRIIAHAYLTRQFYGSRGHVGKIRVSVDPAFRERHLGTWVLLELVNLAMSMGLGLLVMHLVEDRDESVIKGLKKLEFNQEAVLEGHVRDQEGLPHNLVIMVKRLHRGWE